MTCGLRRVDLDALPDPRHPDIDGAVAAAASHARAHPQQAIARQHLVGVLAQTSESISNSVAVIGSSAPLRSTKAPALEVEKGLAEAGTYVACAPQAAAAFGAGSARPLPCAAQHRAHARADSSRRSKGFVT